MIVLGASMGGIAPLEAVLSRLPVGLDAAVLVVRHVLPEATPVLVSAAQHFGARCIAVILSGHLDDGTAGARHLARHGGTTIVQSPAEADAPSMPLNVLHRDSPAFVLEGRDIADVLVELAGETAPGWLPEGLADGKARPGFEVSAG